MFASVALAHRIDAAEAELTLAAGGIDARRDSGTLVAALGGGAAVSTVVGSPFDKVIGLGFAAFDDAALAAFVAFEVAVLARGGVVQVELASLADPSVARALGRRGYGLVGFENVLGRRVDQGPTEGGSEGVLVSRAAPDEQDTWISAVATAFATPDAGDGPASHEAFPRAMVERAMRDMTEVPGFTSYLARREGVVAGGGSMRVDAERRIAQLTGAATLPAQRRRGVQSALLRARLAEAARVADVAVVTTRPGSRSQENAMKNGFGLLYTRAMLLKPAP